MNTIQALAKALDIRVSDFLRYRNENLHFVHGKFRKNCKLTTGQQEYIRESIEEYISRFYSIVDILGGEVLSDEPKVHQIMLTESPEQNKVVPIRRTAP